ncbi:hypothetical protein [Rhizobium gallicum]|uniref:hypothetical protein n=1 Tax=Rhizobium gallicum TaxID=56730 RepID=UPI001EF90EAB|nr:hypothetical protein [Rhizobium gallicum]ULJ73628.1 hypothetical protein L2W42_08670 [Rhizobium gallicum]
MTFWDKASIAERLAQIDGGIELCMTKRQIAMNCGTTMEDISAFGRQHGRLFPAKNSGSVAEKKGGRRGGSITRILRARAAGAHNLLMADAFNIFDKEEQVSPFEAMSEAAQ